MFCCVSDGKESGTQLLTVFNSDGISAQCAPLSLPLLPSSVVAVQFCPWGNNDVFTWPHTGCECHYIMLLVIVNSSDHSGVKSEFDSVRRQREIKSKS